MFGPNTPAKAYAALKGKQADRRAQYITVPWFSSNEWKQVYEDLFGNDANGWKNAYSQLSVWKARSPQLAIGIEGSLPLIHARLALTNTSMEESFINSILNMSILRFVSVVIKGFENYFLQHKNRLHNVAEKMNLPLFLVELRNKIIHSETGYNTTRTLENALESCFSWIKACYWDLEFNSMENVCSFDNCEETLDEFNSSWDVNHEEEDNIDSENSECDVDLEDLQLAITAFNEIVFEKSNKNKIRKKELVLYKKDLLKSINKNYNLYKRGIFKELIDHLLCSELIPEFLQTRRTYEAEPCITQFLASMFSPIVKTIKGDLTNFISSILSLSKKSTSKYLHFEWVRVFAWTSISDSESNDLGKVTRFDDFESEIFKTAIEWETIIYSLMETKDKPYIDLAIELSKLIFKNDTTQCDDILEKVSSAYAGITEYYSNCGTEPKKRKWKNKSGRGGKRFKNEDKEMPDREDSCDVEDSKEIKTIDNLLSEAHKNSPAAFSYIEDLKRCVVDDKEAVPYQFNENVSPLGVLPHQMDDPDFYKKLILEVGDCTK